MKKKIISVVLMFITVICTMNIAASAASYSNRNTYNDVFASTRGSGYNLSQARSCESKTFTKGQFIYVWGYVHDSNNNLYKSYSSGTCNMTLSIYRPNGSCAYSYKYQNSDNNWIGTKLDVAGTWKIQSKIEGSIYGTNTQIITVKENNTRKSYNGVFASTRGSGYNLSQAKATASTTFTKGQFAYIWGYIHDSNDNLYKSYGSGTCNMTLSIYRPNGSCAYTYTYKNSDNNWIGTKLDAVGTWRIQSTISGSLHGTNTQKITVKDVPTSLEITGDIFYHMPTVGDIYYLNAKAYPNANKFTWSSSNSNVVSINSNGKMVAKAAGKATITVRTSDGRSKSETITVYSANKHITGRFGSGYTNIKLNANAGDGKIRIYTYDAWGKKTNGQIHVTLRNRNGGFIKEFDAKSGDTITLNKNCGDYRVYITAKKYLNTIFSRGDDFINVGKCQSWAIDCTSNCYVW